jgi:trehalose/maltose transport system substrate-binding protein
MRSWKTVIIISTLLAVLVAWTSPASSATLKLSCAAVGQELALCKEEAEAWARQTGNTVQVVPTPANATARLALYQKVFAERSDAIDVLQIDVVWPGLLEKHLLDLKPHAKGIEQDHFGGVVANNTVNGRLVAMPWFMDAGLLFYRRDLLAKYELKLPKTWADLQAAARKVQDAERAAGNPAMWGYVWQGRGYEGLSCNVLEWLVSHGGGSIVDQGGRSTVRNERAARALGMAASFIGSITPPQVLDFGEEESRSVFQSGNAVFMRNWPYAWSLAQAADSPIRGKVGITVLPKSGEEGGRFAATLGGQQLAVSRYSKNAALAADLVMVLTSAQVQKERAIKGSFNPTLWPLYADRDILKANPFMGELFGVLAFAIGRPATVTAARYNDVSEAVWTSAREVLSGKVDAPTAVRTLDAQLIRIGHNGRWD